MELDIQQTSTIDLTGTPDFKVQAESTDGTTGKGTIWTFPKFAERYGYYLKIPELKKAIDVYATWVLGKGLETETSRDKVLLEFINGWGEDTFTSIMWNMLVIKKVNGDSFAEIIRNDNGDLINLKPLTPQRMKVVVNAKGMIEKYVYENVKGSKEFQPKDIFHLVNDRVADNIHGESVIDSIKWTIDAVQESLADKRRQLHRSTMRVMEVDEDDKTRLTALKRDYKEAIKSGDVLLVPKGTGSFQDLAPSNTEHIEWTRYLENRFYKAVGIPKTLVGDAEGITESGGKVAYLSHEPIYTREVTELEADIWNQLAIRVTFNKQASLQEGMNDTANKNNAQTSFQPQDTQETPISQ